MELGRFFGEEKDMEFTIPADSQLARTIRDRKDLNVTLQIIAHDPTFTDIEKLVTARMMSWTVSKPCGHQGCSSCPDVMEIEWADHTKFLEEMCTWPAVPDLSVEPQRG